MTPDYSDLLAQIPVRDIAAKLGVSDADARAAIDADLRASSVAPRRTPTVPPIELSWLAGQFLRGKRSESSSSGGIGDLLGDLLGGLLGGGKRERAGRASVESSQTALRTRIEAPFVKTRAN